MKTREPKPTGRKLKVRWSTEEWEPTIQFAQDQAKGQASGLSNRREVRAIQVVLDPTLWVKEKNRRRKIEPVLWVRVGGRIGSRSTWR